jgi:FkbM family methyltransferase
LWQFDNSLLVATGDARVHDEMTKSIKAFLRNMLPRQVKAHRILAGPLRGHKMVTSWHRNFSGLVGRTEPGVNSWFASNARVGETWLDIGANYGVTALRLADLVGPTGRVFAFEPKLDTCGNLASTVAVNAMPQVIVVPVALGSNQDLDVRRFATSGSMAVGTNLADGPQETLMVARLDWLWPRLASGVHRIDGVKIDVQGMELEVLRGMMEILRTQTPRLCVELHAGVDRKDLLDLLESCGYHRRGAPVTNGTDREPQPLYLDNASYAFTSASEATPAPLEMNALNRAYHPQVV